MILEQKLSNPETVDENILYEDVYLTKIEELYGFEENLTTQKQKAQQIKNLCINFCDLTIFMLPKQIRIFPNLKVLALDNNKLQSIQQLNFVSLPNIQKLYLYSNQIVCLKPLHKIIANKFIKEISFSMNPLVDPLSVFHLVDSSSIQQIRIFDCSFVNPLLLPKINSPELQQIGVDHINQKLKDKLKKQIFTKAK